MELFAEGSIDQFPSIRKQVEQEQLEDDFYYSIDFTSFASTEANCSNTPKIGIDQIVILAREAG